jgi:hypothetical protein
VENHLLEQIAWRKRSSYFGLYLISGSTPSAFFPQPNGALRTSCFAITYRRRGSKPFWWFFYFWDVELPTLKNVSRS